MNLDLTLADFFAMSPLLIVLAGALLVLLIESMDEQKSRRCSFFVTLTALIVALIVACYSPASESPLLTPWLRFDSLARIFTIFFLLIGCCSAALAYSFFETFEATHGEYYFLLLSGVFGLILIGSSADFLTLFLGLETLSIALYVLCGYMKKWSLSHEAALKYFLMGALAASFLLYGIALIYGAAGTTRFADLGGAYRLLESTSDKVLFLSGTALITLGLLFKAAIVPFHTWAPDVYDGAPTPVTAFMAVGTKVGAFAALTGVFFVALPEFNGLWNEGMALFAYPTLIYANFVALKQTQLRRFFAYSGISHAGFLLIPFAVGSGAALQPLMFYLVVYALGTLGAFSVLSFLDRSQEGVLMRDLQGLFHRSPLLAAIFALSLLTLAGIPPTAGFFAKFYLFKIAFEAGYYGLVIAGLLTTIVSAYYYLRFIAVMFAKDPAEMAAPRRSWPAAVVGLGACAVIAVLSCYPAPLVDFMQK